MKKLLALIISTVLILASGCSSAPRELTQEDLEYERKVYIEETIEGMYHIKKCSWYENDLTLVGIAPAYTTINPDELSTVEKKKKYYDTNSKYRGTSTSVGNVDIMVIFVDGDGYYYDCLLRVEGEETIKNFFGQVIGHKDKAYFISLDKYELAPEALERRRQEGDYIYKAKDDGSDYMSFFVEAEEIENYRK